MSHYPFPRKHGHWEASRKRLYDPAEMALSSFLPRLQFGVIVMLALKYFGGRAALLRLNIQPNLGLIDRNSYSYILVFFSCYCEFTFSPAVMKLTFKWSFYIYLLPN